MLCVVCCVLCVLCVNLPNCTSSKIFKPGKQEDEIVQNERRVKIQTFHKVRKQRWIQPFVLLKKSVEKKEINPPLDISILSTTKKKKKNLFLLTKKQMVCNR